MLSTCRCPFLKTAFASALLAGTAISVSAQLGSNPKSNELEFGKPVKENTECGYLIRIFDNPPLKRTLFYRSGALAVMALYAPSTNGGSAETPRLFSAHELELLLKENSEGSKWILDDSRSKPPLRRWNREDGKAFAVLNESLPELLVASKEYYSEKAELNPKNWSPYQLCLAETLALPATDCVYGVKSGFMSGQGRVFGVEGSAISAATPEVFGLKGALVNSGDGSRGAHLGVVNVESDFEGMQSGLVNILSGKNPGTKAPNAFQFGLVNYARDLDGAQFGLVNVIGNGTLPFMIIFNFDSPVQN